MKTWLEISIALVIYLILIGILAGCGKCPELHGPHGIAKVSDGLYVEWGIIYFCEGVDIMVIPSVFSRILKVNLAPEDRTEVEISVDFANANKQTVRLRRYGELKGICVAYAIYGR